MSPRFGARARVLAGMSCLMVASVVQAQQSGLQPKGATPAQPTAAQPAAAQPAAAQPAQTGQPAAPGSLPWAPPTAPPTAATPSAGAPPPGFLDTTDKRIRDDRP